MKNQEAFNTMVQHLRKQSAKSLQAGSDIKCMYRAPNGLRCAVGCLIPDNEYADHMDNSSLCRVIELVPALQEISYSLLTMMQSIHDGQEVAEWEDGFLRVATQFRLTVPTL